MSYLVLARKYRPQVFDDIVGQEHLIETLKNAISTERVAHAYLFCGPRGVGKTTAARILAKALNCEKGPNPVPCNTCSVCTEITGGRSMDVLEIDGASNRGINEVRELRENVRYAPSGGRSKVYIIDEVHMLTTEAFNALLKTLEEPPSHVVFVFATTEPFKVPATILSRVQRFDFARIPARKITAHLMRIVKEEKIEVAPEALSLLARRAKGALRDALSLLDQIIAATDGAIDRGTVERLLGLVGGDFYYDLVDRFADKDAAGALQLLDTTYTEGAALADVAEGLATHLRDLMLLRLGDDLTMLLDAPESELPRLRSQAERFSTETLVALVDQAAEITVALRQSEHPRLTMELALTEMASAAGRIPLGDLTRRLLALEERLGGSPPPPAKPSGAGGTKTQTQTKTKPKSSSAKTSAPASGPPKSAASGDAAQIWEACLDALKGKSMPLWGIFQTAKAVGLADDGSLILHPMSPIVRERLAEPGTDTLISEALASLGMKQPRVVLEGDETTARSAAAPAGGSETRAEKGEEETDENGANEDAKASPDTRTMGEIFKDEPMLQKALDMFDGEVLP